MISQSFSSKMFFFPKWSLCKLFEDFTLGLNYWDDLNNLKKIWRPMMKIVIEGIDFAYPYYGFICDGHMISSSIRVWISGLH